MKHDIAVICASPPGINPGMDSVDLAFSYFAEKYKLGDHVQFWRLYSANEPLGDDKRKIFYSIIPFDDAFFRSPKAILYWGDFLHMRQYHDAVANRLLASGIYNNIESASKRIQDIFLQSEQDVDVLKKSITFGTTLLFNTVQDEQDPTYRASLERFLKLCKAAWFRDVYSAFKACQIQGSFALDHLGVDCASLINPVVIQSLSKKPMKNAVGVFIGRSAENIEKMVRFASDLAKALSCNPTWLSWGDTGAFPSLPSIFKTRTIRSLDSFSYEPNSQVENALGNLLTYRAIVTDTYHVCVNAWNLGIPAICLAENKYSQSRNVNFGNYFARRDKRHIFMSMYDALDFFVLTDELENKALRNARILHLTQIISSGKLVDAIQKRIRLHAESAEDMLIQALSSLL